MEEEFLTRLINADDDFDDSATNVPDEEAEEIEEDADEDELDDDSDDVPAEEEE